MTVWVACAHVRIWIQVSGGMPSHDGDKPTPGLVESIILSSEDDLPDMVASSSSEGDSSEEELNSHLRAWEPDWRTAMGHAPSRASGGGHTKLAKRNAATSRRAAQPPVSSTAPDSDSAIDAQSRADPADAPSRSEEEDLPDMVASSSSERDSSEK